MQILSIDFETYSEVDIKSCGSYRYIEDPSFELLLTSYAHDSADPVLVDHAQGDTVDPQFLNDLTDPTVLKTAWNCAFERKVIERAFGIYSPPEQWEDTMVLAAQCGLPLSLDGAGTALGLSEDKAKQKTGKQLIRYFCCPCKPTKANGGRTRNLPEHDPEKWEDFKRYNRQDVVAERAIRNLLVHWKPLPEEHAFWCLDARINERGVKICRTLAERAVEMDSRNKEELTAQAVELTGMQNPKSVAQIKAWLMEQEGIEVPSLNKKVIADVVSGLQTDDAKKFMALRSELSKSSVAKYDAMLRAMCDDDHVKGCFQFYGANRTGRFAGKIVQFQNLSKNGMEDLDECRNLVLSGNYSAVKTLYDGVADTLSQLVRTAIIPEEGHRLLISDFSAIEARVIAWIAGEDWRLEVFKNGGDIYCESASQAFKVPVVKHGINGHLRQTGKVMELACGYGGGIGAMKAFGADRMGMTEAEMQENIDKWRESSPKIVALWKSLEKAAIRAVRRRGSAISDVGNIAFTYDQGVLWMRLPSGRRIAYWGIQYEDSQRMPGKKALSYLGVDQKTKRWTRLETYSGKLAENLTQATARDVLRDAMLNLDRLGYDIRASVHDEVIVTEPISSGRTAYDLSVAMCPDIPWAAGLPLKAEGYEGAYYFKE